MDNFKNVCHRIGAVLEYIVGAAFGICLFLGGLGFFGYVAAFCVGGDTAGAICNWLYNTFYVWLIKLGTCATLVSFLSIYLKGGANWQNPIKYWAKKFGKKEKTDDVR